MEFKNILVPTDLSHASQAAFDLAAYEAKMHGAKIYLVHVQEGADYPLYEEIGYQDLMEKYQASEKEMMLNKLGEYAKKYFHDVIVGVEVIEQQKSVGEDLAEYAKGNNCNGIVVASQGHGATNKTLLGSRVIRLLEHSEVPVIVVPQKA